MATATVAEAAAAPQSISAAAVPAPRHPTYDIRQAIRAALEEDSGDLGDVTTLAT